MKAFSIRTALTSWFVGLAALLLLAVCTALVAGLRSTYRANLDDRLLARAQSLLALTEWEAEDGFEVEVTDELSAQLRLAHPNEVIEVWGIPSMTLLHRSEQLIPSGPPSAEIFEDHAHRLETIESGEGRSLRVCTAWSRVRASDEDDGEADAALEEGSAPSSAGLAVIVRVADKVVPVMQQLGSVRWFLFPLVLLAGASVLAFGLLISRRFTRPILELGEAAEAFRIGAPMPMPRRGSGDELDRLADTLDQSFGALHGALERQTRFTSDAAHELRNPLAVVHSAAEVALRRDRSGDEYKSALSDILVTARRMGRIVESLLLLARLDDRARRQAFAAVDLDEVVRGVASGQERVRVERGEGSMEVVGQEGLLGVLVDNLLSNAIRHTSGPVDVRLERRGERVVLTVRDYGEEVTASALRGAFERFVTLDTPGRARDGAGLGLSIVTAVAALHSAELRVVDAEPGLSISAEFASS